MSRCAGRVAYSVCYACHGNCVVAVKILYIVDVCFYLFCYFNHCFYGFNGVFALCALARKHDSIRKIEDSVCNVVSLGACRSGGVCHGFKHLCCGDNGFALFACFLDKIFLYDRHFFKRYLNTKVAAGNHDSVGNFKYLVNIVNTVTAFYFSDNADAETIIFFKYFSYFKYVACGTDKGSCDIVDTHFDTEFDVFFVLFGKGGKIYMDVG